MNFNGIELTKKKDNGHIICVIDGTTFDIAPAEANYSAWLTVYKDVVNANYCDRARVVREFTATLPTTESAETTPPTPLSNEEILTRGLNNLMKFFKDFEFEPNFRFVNTLSLKLGESNKAAQDYVTNYFNLTDNQYKNEVASKCKSKEFTGILNDIKAYGTPKNTVNNRFKIYYGSAGTGKTTLGMNESDNRCIVCNASMLPSDLMEDFTFNEGKPTFKRTSLRECMEEGKVIVLDEINLLPFESLRFLQGILDGKKEFDYKGAKVQINEGFQIIGTMNLSLGGMIYGLPEPLVDRCADMKEFKLTAEQLMKAISE